MIQWWGVKLTDSYGAECPPDWADLIDRTDDERLDGALVALRQETPAFAPTLGQLEAALPKKRVTGAMEPSVPERLAFEAVRRLTRMCAHQLRGPWTYFGQVTTYPKTKHRDYEVTNPEPHGVVIAACQHCGEPSHRLRMSDLPTAVAGHLSRPAARLPAPPQET